MYINWKPNYIPGDLVYNHKGEVIRITSSYLKGTRLFYYKTDEMGESAGCILEEVLKPIPLTPEILEKNGWKDYFKGSIWKELATKRAYLYITKDQTTEDEYLVCCGMSKCNLASIKYVHQLQHLLFGLELNSEMEV